MTPQALANVGGLHTVYANDSAGKVLTWVSIINLDTGKVVYDPLVEPPSSISDYVTRFSGITAAGLDLITPTLADVQTHLRPLIKGFDNPGCIDLPPHARSTSQPRIVCLHYIAGMAGTIPKRPAATELTILRARYRKFRADFKRILARIARSHSLNRRSNDAWKRTGIVDHEA